MSAADDVKEAFTGKRGKILLFGGGAVVIAYVIYTRRNGTPADTVADPNAQDAVPTDSGRVPQTDPVVGNTTSGSSSTSTRPTSNSEWLASGTDLLVGRGTPSSAAFSALNKALNGEQVTEQEKAWVSQVISALGTPPDGMPPLQSSAPTATTSPALKAPANVKCTQATATYLLFDWDVVPGATGYAVWLNGTGRTPPLYSSTSFYGLKPNTTYTFKVAGRGKGTLVGPATQISAKTKAK